MLHNAQDINRMLDSNLANRYSHLNKKDFLILTNKLNELIGKLKDMPNFKKIKRLGESKTRHSNILERSNKKEFLGFGKKKAKDTTLDWSKASKIIEAELQNYIKRYSDIDWYSKKPKVREDYLVISSMTDTSLQVVKSGGIIVYSHDLPNKNFDWSIEDGKVKGLAKAFDVFRAMDKKQGEINAEKNKKYRKESLSRKRHFESRKRRMFKEGAGAGVLIQVPHIEGEIVSVEKDTKNDGCILVTLKNAKMEDCTLSTYYNSSEWERDFTNGNVVLYIALDEVYENGEEITTDEIINDIELYNWKHDDITISHGGGYVHNSLEGECHGDVFDGIVYEWRYNHRPEVVLKSKGTDYYYGTLEEIDFDFDSQIEEYYEESESDWMNDNDDDIIDDDEI
jgi:hypothetical protein